MWGRLVGLREGPSPVRTEHPRVNATAMTNGSGPERLFPPAVGFGGSAVDTCGRLVRQVEKHSQRPTVFTAYSSGFIRAAGRTTFTNQF